MKHLLKIRSDLFRLTWSEIDLKEGIIELRNGRGKTGAPQAIPIVTPELKALITELQAERRRVPNVDGLVFTIDGKPIDKVKFEYHFRAARKAAKIKNFPSTTSDTARPVVGQQRVFPLRRRCRQRVTIVASHKRYQNLQQDQPENRLPKSVHGAFTRKTEREESAVSADFLASPTGFEPVLSA